MQLGEILVRKQIISAEQLQQVIDLQSLTSKRLGELLLEYCLISSENLTLCLQEQYWRRHGYWVID